jgi:hypothetical protein
LAVELLAFGPFLRELGFYHDDWPLLEQMAAGGGYWARVTQQWATAAVFRPAQTLVWPLAYAAFGDAPLPYHVLALGFDWLAGCAFALLVLRLTGASTLSFLAGALAILLPTHPATHHWWVNASCSAPALACALAGLVCHTFWLERGGRRLLAASLGAYGLSLLWYEAFALLPLALLPILPRGGLKGAARALAPLGAALAAALLIQAWLIPALSGVARAKSLDPSLHWFGVVARAGLQALTTELARLCRLCWTAGLAEFTDGWKAVWAVVVCGAFFSFPRETAEPSRQPGKILGAAALLVLAGFLPYAVSGRYEPQIVGLLSRVTAGAALGAALGLACAVEALRSFSRPAGAALAALLLGAFVWTDWLVARRWSQAWTTQKSIVAGLAARKAELPEGALVLLDAPVHLGGAPLFSAPWDFSSALRLATGRRDLNGRLLSQAGAAPLLSERTFVYGAADGLLRKVKP